MLITIGIAWALIAPAIAFFQQVSVVEFLTGTKWAPRFKPPAYGVLPLVMGTLWTTGIALLVAVPFGLGAAVYLVRVRPGAPPQDASSRCSSCSPASPRWSTASSRWSS